MNPLPFALAALALVAAAPAPSFDGVWVADLNSQSISPYPDVYLAKDGQYRCDSCTPPRAYPADGKARPVPGDTETTSESVAITGPRTIVTRIDSPALKRVTTMTVAADDKTATYVSIDHRPDLKGPLRTEYLARRVAPAPAGAHPVSGSWQGVRYVTVPWQVRTVTLKVADGRLSYSVPTGVRYSAVIDGAPARVEGPYKGAMFAAVKRVDARTLVETRTEDGRVLFTRTYALSADGRSLRTETKSAATGAVFAATSHRKGLRVGRLNPARRGKHQRNHRARRLSASLRGPSGPTRNSSDPRHQ